MPQGNKSFLITRPDYDLVTKYLCLWSQEVISTAESKSFAFYDLKGVKATKSKLDSYINSHNPGFIFLNGHGNTNIITGHDHEVIIQEDSKLGEAIVYARSCDSGERLGGILVAKKSVRAFVGYRRKFILGYTPEKMMKPLEDEIAKLFLEPSNLMGTIILKGHKVSDAHNRSKEAMYQNFRRMVSSSASFEERHAARWLWSNINSQVLIGDGEAQVV